MSCFVNTPGGSGVDLNSMLSGERWMYGMIIGKQIIVPSPWGSGETYATYVSYLSDTDADYYSITGPTLMDFSNISQIQFGTHVFNRSAAPGNSCPFTISFKWNNRSQEETLNYSASCPKSGHVVVYNTFSFTKGTKIGQFEFYHQGEAYHSVGIFINSFTTTDGKTHTATNLNY